MSVKKDILVSKKKETPDKNNKKNWSQIETTKVNEQVIGKNMVAEKGQNSDKKIATQSRDKSNSNKDNVARESPSC